MRGRQLYTSLKEVCLPDHNSPSLRSRSLSGFVVDDFPFVRWPNGKPCVAVNAYILDAQLDGVQDGTLKGYAANLSHVVRYCASHNTGFDSLTDNDIWNLSEVLATERNPSDPTTLRRNPNTNKTILRATLVFLAWYQARFLAHTKTPLIGEASDTPQITVRIKVNERRVQASRTLGEEKKRKISLSEFDRSGSHYLVHRAFPSEVSTDPKRPITQEQIQAIEKVIDTKADADMGGIPSPLLSATREYLRARRMFTVFLMKRTGLRPGELLGISADQNVVKNKSIEIPTLKGRKKEPFIRKFPFRMKDGLRFNRYVSSRTAFTRAILAYDPGYKEPKGLLLSSRGLEISTESITKDFTRLTVGAGFEDVNLCLRQFRIRFITQQVAMHLKKQMQKTGRDQQSFEEADYTTVLKRIAELTGHKSEQSLWFYVDLGWEELGLWTSVDRSIERLNAADTFFDELMELKHDAKKMTNMASEQIVDFCVQRLGQIIGANKALLEEPDDEVFLA
ncbi:tyrosine-type recombinase/integrase [Solemya elarraichensis gill symbiont]|uniref:Tyr recombinase domain-containing protein n=1 Tax=Solemya elarraichensis gill symbiont TaxID=1918949 RepID=A0A1T2LCN8_9GAMM|nr:tyrosine-type recombinase/integrase [Solemya elarraichensis gill symbiont]OOZ42706.1 hypothetical protein BOW52_01875 [Solemya elarraichensis gill symbiont]